MSGRPMNQLTINVNDAAKELGVRVDEIYRLIRSGRLKAIKVNRRLEIDYEDFQLHMMRVRG